jgi:hypothetical protein
MLLPNRHGGNGMNWRKFPEKRQAGLQQLEHLQTNIWPALSDDEKALLIAMIEIDEHAIDGALVSLPKMRAKYAANNEEPALFDAYILDIVRDSPYLVLHRNLSPRSDTKAFHDNVFDPESNTYFIGIALRV